jgi:hypothetical protein
LAQEEVEADEQEEQEEQEEILTMIDDGEPSFQSQENGWHIHQHHQQSGVELVVDDSWHEQQQQRHDSSSLASPVSTCVSSLSSPIFKYVRY